MTEPEDLLDSFQAELQRHWNVLKSLTPNLETNLKGHAGLIIDAYAAAEAIRLALWALPLLEVRSTELDALWRDIQANFVHYSELSQYLYSLLLPEL